MPKILPTLAAPAKAAAAGAADSSSSTSRVHTRKSPAGRGAFDQALSGARKKEATPAPAPAEPERRADRTTARPESRKAVKAKDRADARETAQAAAEADSETRHDRVDAEAAAETGPVEHEADGKSSEVDGKKPTAGRRPVGGAKGDARRDGESRGIEAGAEGHGIEGGVEQVLPTIELPSGELTDLPTEELTETGDVEADAKIATGGTANLSAPAQLAAANQVHAEPLSATANLATGGDESPGSSADAETASGVAQLTPTKTQDVDRLGQVGRTAQRGAGPEGVTTPAGAEHATGGQPAGPEAQARSAESVAAVEALDSALAADQSAQAAAAAPTPVAAPPVPGGLSPEVAAGMVHDVAAKSQPQAAPAPAALPAVPAEVRFAEDNHANIVAGMRGQLMPEGGTIHIRLDPPQLGPLAVTVRVRGGVMEASFETASDEAAKLLSHSLGALKSSLESHGMNVERLHVTQAPKDPAAPQDGGGRDAQQSGQQGRDLQQEQSARQEQQRREMLRRMWRKLAGMGDPLDMVA